MFDARFPPSFESFPGTPNPEREVMVEAGIAELLVVLNGEPPRAPHEIVYFAVAAIVV
jgi:hypothetical protein